jgi:hypothetical protein
MSFLDDIPGAIYDALGDDFRDASLARSGVGAGDAWNPASGTTQSWTCKAIFDEWGSFDRAQGLVSASDRKVLILAISLATTPQVGDQIAIDGTALTVVSDGEGQPGVSTDPAKAVWVLRCRV